MRLFSSGSGWFVGCLLLAMAGCNSTQESMAKVAVEPPVPALNVAGPLPPVAATYITRRSVLRTAPHEHEAHEAHAHEEQAASAVRSTEWRFFREADLVEIEDLASQSGELWQRDGSTQFFFKLFHADRRSIEYRMDDLRMLNIAPGWQQSALLVDSAVLQQLRPVAAGWRDGHPFRRMQGEVAGTHWDIVWRLDLNLPARIEARRQQLVEVTELQAAYALEHSPWQRRERLAYEVIDYADLGDRESDPFITRIQQQLPGAVYHRH